MNEYEVTYTNGEVVVVAARTPEMALSIAELHAELQGYVGLAAVSTRPLAPLPNEA